MTPRDEIRAAGIICPSCGLNAADLPAGHRLVQHDDGSRGAVFAAECRDGRPVHLEDFGSFRAAANISLLDEFRADCREMDEAAACAFLGEPQCEADPSRPHLSVVQP